MFNYLNKIFLIKGAIFDSTLIFVNKLTPNFQFPIPNPQSLIPYSQIPKDAIVFDCQHFSTIELFNLDICPI